MKSFVTMGQSRQDCDTGPPTLTEDTHVPSVAQRQNPWTWSTKSVLLVTKQCSSPNPGRFHWQPNQPKRKLQGKSLWPLHLPQVTTTVRTYSDHSWEEPGPLQSRQKMKDVLITIPGMHWGPLILWALGNHKPFNCCLQSISCSFPVQTSSTL